MSKQTTFNPKWLTETELSKWVAKHPTDSRKARCFLCGKDIELGNMGKQALTSHAKGEKHKLKSMLAHQVKQEHQSVSSFFTKVTQPIASTSRATPSVSTETDEATANLVIPVPPPLEREFEGTRVSVHKNTSAFLIKEDVLKAEIIWVAKTVIDHYSSSSSSDTDKLFKKMFPDSTIARQFQCGKTKCSYLIRYGLAPYFHKQVLDAASGEKFSLSFDESFNKVLEKEQMDLIIRFWSREKNKVISYYLTSKFLGHTRASDLLAGILAGLGTLNHHRNLLQISMDGPSTNWKLLADFIKHREQNDPEDVGVLQVGCCGLHVIHGALKTGAQATGWNIDSLLRSLYYLLHDAPARAEDYSAATGGASLPKRFCGTRWLEDSPVAERAISIWPSIQQYVTKIESGPKSKVPKIQSFCTVQKCVHDPLIIAKLQFFVTQCKQLTPFLQIYQTESPMMPFMADDLHTLVKTLMSKFVVKDVIKQADNSVTKLLKIDVECAENMKPVKKIEIGFAVKVIVDAAEKSKKVSALQLREFYTECQSFLKRMTLKILERSPLRYSVVKYLPCLDPRKMADHPDSSHEKFTSFLGKLLEAKHLTAIQCDETKHQYEDLLSTVRDHHHEEFRSFTPKQPLDTFFYNILGQESKYSSLWMVIKMALVLSHGQSEIERGFSVNKDILSDNMQESTIIAYRHVYDGIRKLSCKAHDLPITKEMMASCRHSYSRYKVQMEDLNKKKKAEEAIERKRKHQQEISEARKKVKRLESEVNHLLSKADILSNQAEKSRKWSTLAEANGLRDKGNAKKKEVEEAQKELASMESQTT